MVTLEQQILADEVLCVIFKPGMCWPVHTWFLRIASVREHLYACVSTPKAINNYWRDVV